MSGEAALMVEDGSDFVELKAMRQLLRAKILHTLSIWPYLNPSMLQVGIGTAVAPRIWHPVKDALIKEGLVVQEEIRARSHVGRDQVYTILRLSTAPQHVTPLTLPNS